MKRRTEKIFRNIVQLIDEKLDELAAQEPAPRLRSAPDVESTPIGRVKAKLDELALAIEFELQLDKVTAKGSQSGLSGLNLEDSDAKDESDLIPLDSEPTPTNEVSELSPFEKSVEKWFRDNRLYEDGDE